MFLPDYQNLTLGAFRSKMSALESLGKPEQEFLFANITEWQHSDVRKLMLTAQDYYGNDNDIKDRIRYYIDRKGNKQEASNLSNSKLAHPFMRKLTNQKVNYLLSKELTIQCDDELFSEAIGKYINKKFLRMLKRVGKDAIVNGIAWVQVYYNAEGVLSFKRIPSEEIIPFWADADHTILEGVIRVYSVWQYLQNGYKKEIFKVEYHTTVGVWYYILGEKGLKPDPDKGENLHGHFVVNVDKTDDQGQPVVDEEGKPVTEDIQATWDKVPFIGFKYNDDELSLLKWIKPLVDDYDLNTSDTSNTLQDIPNSIKVVRNYDGTDKGEFVQNLAIYRTAFVSGDGDMTSLETKLDTVSIEAHLNRLKDDIYEAGSGVDTQDDNLGNASGVALEFRYAGLNMDMTDMGNEFAAALEELIWFIKVDMLNSGIGDFMETEFDVIFNTDMIVNESEVITDAKNSVGIISDETILANHPWVTDADAEMERMKQQKEEAMAEAQEMMATEFAFDQAAEMTEDGGGNEGGDI